MTTTLPCATEPAAYAAPGPTTDGPTTDGPADPDAPSLPSLQARFRPVFDRIAQGAAERERTRSLAHEPIAWLRDSGFTALRVPRRLGGAGASVEQLFALWTELAEADSNVAQILRPHFGFLDRVLIDRDAATQARWLPLAARGAVFGNATTEVGTGTLGTLQTTLVPDAQPGWWRLDGRKFYSTGTLYADWVTVVARAVEPGKEDQTVHAVVPTSEAGVQRFDDWRGFGQRLTGSGTTVLSQVRVPDDAVIRFPRAQPTPLVAYFQLAHLATLAGIARALQRDAIAYVQARRRVFSHGSATLPKDDPLVQHIVGQLAAVAGQLRQFLGVLALHAAQCLPQGQRMHGQRQQHAGQPQNAHGDRAGCHLRHGPGHHHGAEHGQHGAQQHDLACGQVQRLLALAIPGQPGDGGQP